MKIIIMLALAVALSSCAYTKPYTQAVTTSGAYKATAGFVGKYHEGTPCSGFRYKDAACD